MTNEFRELTSRLAKGLNFPENSVCLITKLKDEKYGDVRWKGPAIGLTKGICTAIDRILSEASEADAFECRNMIRQSIIADEERRFQNAIQQDEGEAGS